ncbi:SH3 domain-containing protein Dlish [Myzus persicae]|uniref:SH3 domain-containing protein Dlish n=1 Tax=Myzus persicae TaxID=13164 RepID=UPI000B93A066|nr:SH3 domain-containing protein Dlish [Myzus persicae]
MAFLCPVRIRRGKKKKSGSTSDLDKEVLRGTNANGPVPGMGRITGSASIETLVRVGIEKENGLSPDSKMVVLHDFTPCVDDELTVKRGQVVNILYRENDWVYVIAEDSRQEGFIPHSYCTPYNSQLGEIALNNVKKKLPRAPAATPTETVVEVEINEQQKHGNCGDLSDCESFGNKTQEHKNQNKQNISSSRASLLSASSHPEIRPFFKDPAGRYIVLYTFIARDENDVSVERGEFVTVLNREDPDWYWIIRSDGQEGFVPSGFVYPADIIQGHINQMNNNQCAGTTNTGLPPVTRARPRKNSCVADDDPAIHGTEMVMLYDYKPQAPDDLSVKRGEWIYADLTNQMVEGWLWTYAPKTRKYGFIPKAYAHPPAMTSL